MQSFFRRRPGVRLRCHFTQIELNRLIVFRDSDGRVVRLDFFESDKGVTIHHTFDADLAQPEDQQREEWQTVLNCFARYVERQFTTHKSRHSLLVDSYRNRWPEWNRNWLLEYAE